MIRLIDLINERKQAGILYHFTSYANMISIVNSNFILSTNLIEIQSYISFTRNKNLVTDTVANEVRIKVDGTKLSDKYKIEPHADVKAGYGRKSVDESEERISLKRYPKGVDISNCLMAIDVRKPTGVKTRSAYVDFDDEESFEPPSLENYYKLIQHLKKKNIPFNIVDDY